MDFPEDFGPVTMTDTGFPRDAFTMRSISRFHSGGDTKSNKVTFLGASAEVKICEDLVSGRSTNVKSRHTIVKVELAFGAVPDDESSFQSLRKRGDSFPRPRRLSAAG